MPPASLAHTPVTEPPRVHHKDWAPNRSNGGLLTLRRVEDQGPTRLHDHTYDELAFVRAGTAIHLTAAGERLLQFGDVVILQPMVWHAYRDCHDFAIDNLIFDARFLTQLFPLLDHHNHRFERFWTRAIPSPQGPPVIQLDPHEQAKIFAALDQMADEQDQVRPGWETIAASSALAIITHVARAMARAQPVAAARRLSPRAEDAVLTIAQKLREDPAQTISLSDLARSVSVSPHHLSRAFNRHMGVGIVDYLHRVRIERACHLLRTTDTPIAEIAIDIGYDEITYFSRRFRKVLGCSPSTYRQQIRTVSGM